MIGHADLFDNVLVGRLFHWMAHCALWNSPCAAALLRSLPPTLLRYESHRFLNKNRVETPWCFISQGRTFKGGTLPINDQAVMIFIKNSTHCFGQFLVVRMIELIQQLLTYRKIGASYEWVNVTSLGHRALPHPDPAHWLFWIIAESLGIDDKPTDRKDHSRCLQKCLLEDQICHMIHYSV